MTLSKLMADVVEADRVCEAESMGTPIAERVRGALRQVWAVRVLDAYVRQMAGGSYWYSNDDTCGIFDGLRASANPEEYQPDHWHAQGEDAARLAAVESVWPELPEAVRAELGERP